MNLRLSNLESSQGRKDRVISYLHQCKQCGVLFERIGKASDSELGEFSWDSKFMVDKCDMCKNFRMYNVYN
jgi:hypothetical protein